MPSLRRSTGLGPAHSPGSLGDAPVDGRVLQEQADDAIIGLQHDLLEPGEDPGLDPFITARFSRTPDREPTRVPVQSWRNHTAGIRADTSLRISRLRGVRTWSIQGNREDAVPFPCWR
jgi:hypothetical protein